MVACHGVPAALVEGQYSRRDELGCSRQEKNACDRTRNEDQEQFLENRTQISEHPPTESKENTRQQEKKETKTEHNEVHQASAWKVRTMKKQPSNKIQKTTLDNQDSFRDDLRTSLDAGAFQKMGLMRSPRF